MLRVDTSEAEQFLEGLHKDQIPFAASLALNNTAKAAQRGLQTHLASTFILRRADFVLKEAVKIPAFSTKTDDPMAVEVLATERADFMHKFESGITKTSITGGALAVPIEARPSKSALIPRQLRPKQLQLRGHATSGAQDQFKGKLGTFTIRGLGILQRLHGHIRGTRLLYLFRRSAKTPPSLRYQEIGRRIVAKVWPENFAAAFARAIRTAK